MASTQSKKKITAPKRRTQQERKADTERELIAAGIRLFAQKGYLRTTSSEIAAEAGCTAGLVNHRFGSKAGLLKAIMTAFNKGFIEGQLGDAVRTESAEASLRNYIEIYMNEVTVHETQMRSLYVLMGEALGGAEEIRSDMVAFDAEVRERTADIIQRGIESREFRSDVDPDQTAAMITGLLRGIVIQYLFNKQALDPSAMISQLQETVLGSLK